jgi:hypothetical protein
MAHSLVLEIKEESEVKSKKKWKMPFYGAQSRLGVGACIIFTSPRGDTISFTYRLEFDFMYNVAEYEALFLGLELARDMGIKVLEVNTRDSNLVVM